MNNVNTDAKEAVDTFSYFYKTALELWEMTPIELKAYIGAMFILSILLQYIKKAFLVNSTKKERIRKLWIYSMPLSFAIAYLGYFIYGTKIHFGWFILIALTVSTVSMGIHRIAIDYIFPFIGKVFSAVGSRLMLFIRGKPAND